MGQINLSYGLLAASLSREAYAPLPQGTEEVRTQRQALTKATQTLNRAGFAGEGREVTFSLDAATKRPVVKVVDTDSREVVAQWPSEYVLRMAEELKQFERKSR